MKEITLISINIAGLLCVLIIFTSGIVIALAKKEGVRDKAYKAFAVSIFVFFAFLLGYLMIK